MAKSGNALLQSDELWTAASKLQVIVDRRSSSIAGEYLPNPLILKGFNKGSIAEIYGRRSSGKTSLCFHILSQATARGEVCAVVDLHNSFHPESAQAAGAELEQIVWVRCQGDAQHTMRAADLLLHAGGFGVVLLDLGEASPQALNRIPLSYWYRLRRAVEYTPTLLLVCADTSEVKCSFINKLAVKRKEAHWAGAAPFERFQGLETLATSSKAFGVASELLSVSLT